MYPIPKNYAAYPAVYPLHRLSEVTILAKEPAFLFFDNMTYKIRINAMEADTASYSDSDHFTFFDVIGVGGVLRFQYAFELEGPYEISIFKENTFLAKLVLYALDSDMYGLRPVKGDLHVHSYRSDGKRCPMAQPGHYREQGYDFLVLTDHNRYAPSNEAIEAFEKVELGMLILNGEEVHTPGTDLHLVHAGGSQSVSDIYYKNPVTYESDLESLRQKFRGKVPDQYLERYIRIVWASSKIHAFGGVSIFPHPYWMPTDLHTYHCNTDYASFLLKSGLFDAFEVIGGQGQDGNDISVSLYHEMRERGVTIPVVGSSDTHELSNSNTATFAHDFTVLFVNEFSQAGIVDAVRNGRSVAVESVGGGADQTYRVVGCIRFVRYVRFLLDWYFPETKRICEGEGVMMRQYLIGEEDGKLLSALANRVEKYYARFFGIEPPVLPSVKLLKKEERWRKIQMKSPKGKGSLLFNGKETTRQI